MLTIRTQDEKPFWTIRVGFIVSGSFVTERERMLVEAVNEYVFEERGRISREAYRRGLEDGKAIYAPRTWIGRLFG